MAYLPMRLSCYSDSADSIGMRNKSNIIRGNDLEIGEMDSLAQRAADTDTSSPLTYVPTLELTKGQAAPIAANGGLSFMALEQNGDGGTTAAIEQALSMVAKGAMQRLTESLSNAPPGSIATKWGEGFRTYDECVAHIRSTNMKAPEGGVVLPLRYTVFDQSTYSLVSSHAAWRDPVRAAELQALNEDGDNYGRQCLYFPHVLRDARRIEEYHPGLSPYSAESMDKLGVSLAHCESKCNNFYDAAEVERVFYPEMEQLLLDFFPGATDALVFNHDVFDQAYGSDRVAVEDQDNKDPGVTTEYISLVHNDLNDNSGRVRCRELLTSNLRNFGREQHYTEAQADEKMSRRFMSLNLAKPMETVQQWPFVLCAWPSFADQPYISDYRIYDDRVGETTRFTHRAGHEWYWLPQQTSTEVSMLKCYDSVTDGSVSRWSFHTAAKDPTAPGDVPCRKNVLVRAYVFF